MENEEIDYSVCMPVVRHDRPGGRGFSKKEEPAKPAAEVAKPAEPEKKAEETKPAEAKPAETAPEKK